MGSTSDWDVMSDAAATLAQFGVEFEKRVVSATAPRICWWRYAKCRNQGSRADWR